MSEAPAGIRAPLGALRRGGVFLAGLSFLLLGLHLLVAERLLGPDPQLGSGYAVSLPMLLEGYYWLSLHGGAQAPLFTPAWCGGVPFLPDPHNLYTSLPQLLTLAASPLLAAHLSILLFAAIGTAGAYVLARWTFRVPVVMAVLAAALFGLNGFYWHRMLAGELGFQPFMLVPWLAVFALGPLHWGWRAPALAVGVGVAYVIWAGMIDGLIAVGLALVMLALLYRLAGRPAVPWLVRLMSGAAVAVLLSLWRLLLMRSYLQGVPVPDQPPVGLPAGLSSVLLLLRTLFWDTPLQWSGPGPAPYTLDAAALGYSVGVVPLLVGGALLLRRWQSRGRALPEPNLQPRRHQRRHGLLLALVALLPFALTLQLPGWDVVRAMVIESDSIVPPLHQWSSYIPLLAVASAVGLARLTAQQPAWGALLGAVAVAMTVLQFVVTVLVPVPPLGEPYSPRRIEDAYLRTRQLQRAEPISYVGVYRNAAGQVTAPVYRNDLFTAGGSQLRCNQPLFGPHLERFPLRTLHVGPITDEVDGTLNLKRPECFLFGKSIGCAPGAHFVVGDEAEALAFARRELRPVFLPGWLRAAGWVTGAAWLLVLGGLVVWALARMRARAQRRHRPQLSDPR